jgi:hypothetical protein
VSVDWFHETKKDRAGGAVFFIAGRRLKNPLKCLKTGEPLAKPCFASGVFRCQVSGVRKNHTMLRLPET